MPRDPTFEVVESGDAQPGRQLIFGVSHLGMAGVSAANYLVSQFDVEAVGHVATTGFQAISPFENGEPRHPMRLYASDTLDTTVFVGESVVPVWAAEAFADGLLDWIADTGVEELVLLYGVPFPHGPDHHEVYYTATPEYRERNLDGSDLEPLAGSFLDGVVAELVLGSLDGEAPPTGVFITPSHPPGPDLEAALLLLDAIQGVCEFDVDERELRATADRMKQYYSELASRMEALS